jgi:hypothetical protein
MLILSYQTEAFFNRMAFDMDLSEPPQAEEFFESLDRKRDPLKPAFEPMRRKMDIRVDA